MVYTLPTPTGQTVRDLHETLVRFPKKPGPPLGFKFGSSKLKGRTYEDIHGADRAKALKEERSESNRKRPWPKVFTFKGRKHSELSKLLLQAAARVRSTNPDFLRKQREAHLGLNTMTTKQRQEVAARHAALNLPNCCCPSHGGLPGAYMISSLTWKLAEVLVAVGFEKVIAEQQFGRKRVDVLLADEWIAFEADGFYHFTAKRRAYDAQRDEDLKKRFDLPVVRLSGVEVKRLYKELVEEGGDANGLRATSPNRSNG